MILSMKYTLGSLAATAAVIGSMNMGKVDFTKRNQMPSKNKYDGQTRFELYNVEGTIKRTDKAVVMEIQSGGSSIFALHFEDPEQMTKFFVLMMEQMFVMFPDYEPSKLWEAGKSND